MRWKDTARGYGWISIILHWLTVLAVLALLYIGDSISVKGEDTLHLHTSIAVSAYAILIFRIFWRLNQGHPGPTEKQKGWGFTAGKIVHYLLLAAIALMLVSGPVMAWAAGMAIHVFDWVAIPAPFAPHTGLYHLALKAHQTGAIILALGTVVHATGALKHALWNNDETMDRMMFATKEEDQGPQG